jgi:hypothetical protein
VSTTLENRVRRKAARLDYRVEKSRQGIHANNMGRYQLIGPFGPSCSVVLGSDFDATLEQIEHYLDKVAAADKTSRLVAA